MADARLLRTSVEITAPSGQGDAAFTASGKAIQFAGFLRAYVEGSDDPAAALDDQETILPTLSRGQPDRRRGRRRRDARAARLEGARDHAAGALHRRLAGEAPRGRGHRPAVDLRLDHQDDPGPRLRVPPRQGAGPQLHRVRGHRACCGRTSPTTSTSASPRRWRRTSTRSPAASGRRSTSSAISIAASTGRPGLEQRAQSDDQIPYPAVDVGTDPADGPADPRPHRPLRPVPGARRRRRRPHRVAARRGRAGRLHRRAGGRPPQRQGRRAALARRPPDDGREGLPADRPLRSVRAARRDAGEGRQGRQGAEAEARLAAEDAVQRVDADARPGAPAPGPAARGRHASGRRQADRRQLRPATRRT